MTTPVPTGVRAACYVLLPRDPAREGAARAQLDALLRARGVRAVRYLERADGRRRRPKLKLLLSRAAQGPYDVVYVLRFGDLASSRSRVADLAVQLGVPVTSAQGTTLDPADPVVRWLAAERGRHSARIKRGHAAKRVRGECVGEPPWGYRLAPDGVHLEPDEHEQAAERLALHLLASGKGPRTVARKVTEAGYRSREDTAITHVQVGRWRRRVQRGG